MKDKKEKKITRQSKDYADDFYDRIMDDSYAPINKIWHNDNLGRLGTYGSITNGKQKRNSYKDWLRYNEKKDKDDFYF
tara:strand:- start:629 stop:862 length:234 start_codon:yes stop_codon:yes gene_type:complete